MTTLAITCVKNEAPFLIEWLAHHRAVGIDHFLVYSNDCSDGTDVMLDHIARDGWLTHIRNDGPYGQGGIQFTALNHAAKHPQYKAADWIIAFDVDEFINIKTCDHTISALHAALPDATAITLTWRMFGNAGIVRFEDRPILHQFDRAAPPKLDWPWRASMFKTLFKNDGTYGAAGVHRPRRENADKLANAKWFDCNGDALPPSYAAKGLFSPFGRENYGLVQLNHYPLGAMETYVLKADRGRVNRAVDMLGMDYWCDRNFNQVVENSITDMGAQLRAQMQADPTLADLHAKAIAWRRAKFDELMLIDEFRALFGRLLMTPPSQIVSPEAANLLHHYARKAHGARG